MCHGHVDIKVVEREVRDRVAAVTPVALPELAPGLPPELMGGLRGLWARLRAAIPVNSRI